MHIINNQLVVIGGQFINTYPLDLSSEPTTVSHGLGNGGLSRFGMAVTENDAYIIGGDFDVDGDGIEGAEKVFKWNLDNQTVDFVVNLPEDRFGGRATIVNDKLYVFGGTTEFAASSPNNTIFIYDLINESITTEYMNTAAEYTYVDKFQNLIYIAGNTRIFNANEEVIGFETTLAVYNTENNIYTDISHNLDLSGAATTIHGLSVFNNKLYLIFGDAQNTGEQFVQWSVMEVPIN
ncbi:MAG: kelch repeat-containing protein [Flavobacteriaceae bacterium]